MQINIYIMCLCMCVPCCMSSLGSQKKASDTMELDSQADVSHLTWVLGTHLGSFGKTASTHDHRAISPALECRHLTGNIFEENWSSVTVHNLVISLAHSWEVNWMPRITISQTEGTALDLKIHHLKIFLSTLNGNNIEIMHKMPMSIFC